MPGQEATVRAMREQDLPALEEIDGLASGSPRPDYLRGKVRAAVDGGPTTVVSLVAELDQRVVGFIMAEVHHGEYGVPENVATVDTVGVHPKYQGQGVGRMLMEELVAHTRKLGVERLRTMADWNQQWELVEYFRAAGFAPTAASIVLERTV